MKKIGEMTRQEFIDALKAVFNDKDENEQEAADKEQHNNFIDEFKEEVKEFFILLKNIVTVKPVRDFFSEPLTQEVFIRRGKKVKACCKELVSTVVFVVVAVIFIRYFICEIRWIPSGSMKPTLIEGDRVLVNRYSRFYQLPERGDIMVFYPKTEPLEQTPVKIFKRLTGFFCEDVAYIKRIIGMPGDKFEIKKDDTTGVFTVYINDEPLEETYIKNPLDYPDCQEGMYCGPFIIPEDNYFMMGDNRGNSSDSRFWGFLPRSRFIGKAIRVARFAKL